MPPPRGGCIGHYSTMAVRGNAPRGTPQLDMPTGGLASAMAQRMLMSTENSHGLWYFPPPPPLKERLPDPDKITAGQHKRAEIRRAGHTAATALVQELMNSGVSNSTVLEEQASASLARRLEAQANRCPRCWHDREQRCICSRCSAVKLALPVRVLVLMHHKEYYRASDDAKLLLMQLPPDQAKLFIFGQTGALESLIAEINSDPVHSMMLWPGDGALTVQQFASALPASSPWRAQARGASGDASCTAASASCSAALSAASASLPLLRVVVLDAVYRSARMMFRHLCKLRQQQDLPPLQHVALHPTTLSVYSRAQHGYAEASARTVSQQHADPEALRICTVEAVALLLEELGEPTQNTRAFVQAVITNNEALEGLYDAARAADELTGSAKERQLERRRERRIEQRGEHTAGH